MRFLPFLTSVAYPVIALSGVGDNPIVPSWISCWIVNFFSGGNYANLRVGRSDIRYGKQNGFQRHETIFLVGGLTSSPTLTEPLLTMMCAPLG